MDAEIHIDSEDSMQVHKCLPNDNNKVHFRILFVDCRQLAQFASSLRERSKLDREAMTRKRKRRRRRKGTRNQQNQPRSRDAERVIEWKSAAGNRSVRASKYKLTEARKQLANERTILVQMYCSWSQRRIGWEGSRIRVYGELVYVRVYCSVQKTRTTRIPNLSHAINTQEWFIGSRFTSKNQTTCQSTYRLTKLQ